LVTLPGRSQASARMVLPVANVFICVSEPVLNLCTTSVRPVHGAYILGGSFSLADLLYCVILWAGWSDRPHGFDGTIHRKMAGRLSSPFSLLGISAVCVMKGTRMISYAGPVMGSTYDMGLTNKLTSRPI
jgi:hypothetical protein